MEEMQDAAIVLLGIETWPRLPHASDSPTNDDITIAYLPHKSSSPNQFEQGSTSARHPQVHRIIAGLQQPQGQPAEFSAAGQLRGQAQGLHTAMPGDG